MRLLIDRKNNRTEICSSVLVQPDPWDLDEEIVAECSLDKRAPCRRQHPRTGQQENLLFNGVSRHNLSMGEAVYFTIFLEQIEDFRSALSVFENAANAFGRFDRSLGRVLCEIRNHPKLHAHTHWSTVPHMCGLHAAYSVKLPDLLQFYLNDPNAYLFVVRGYGKTEISKKGWRSEKIQVHAIVKPSRTDEVIDTAIKWLWERHGIQSLDAIQSMNLVEAARQYYLEQ